MKFANSKVFKKLKPAVFILAVGLVIQPGVFAADLADCLSPSISINSHQFQGTVSIGLKAQQENMLALPEPVAVKYDKSFLAEQYESLYSGEAEVMENLKILADQLKQTGGKLIFVNATSSGGGVAEILHYLVPLYRDLGVDAEWAIGHAAIA